MAAVVSPASGISLPAWPLSSRPMGSVSFGCIALNIHRDFQATYSASKRNHTNSFLDNAVSPLSTRMVFRQAMPLHQLVQDLG